MDPPLISGPADAPSSRRAPLAIWLPNRCMIIRTRLPGGGSGAVEGAGGGADVHVEGDADVGVSGQAGDVGGVDVPGEQGGGAEDVPQAVPGPRLSLGAALGGGEV